MNNNNNTRIPTRFNSLDVLRGFAALSVVLWHWRHFFYSGTVLQNYPKALQPLYSILFLFYDRGYLAVILFFSLSGFIFFWLYSEGIASKKVSAKEFFILRFSRLYPLHFVTLVFVLIIQIIFKSLNGNYFVYQYNDLYHFILNILFVSNWGFQQGLSFNGPVWSVSIEVMLYIIFFVISYFKGTRSIIIPLIIVIGIVYFPYNAEIQRGIFSFFIGGSTYLLYKKIYRYKLKAMSILSGVITFILWIIVFIGAKIDLREFLHYILPNVTLINYIIDEIFKYYTAVLLFPVTILFLVLTETYRGKLGERIKFIGDITYSSYLLHFPLQLVFILILKYLQIGSEYFYSVSSLFLYFGILLILSFLCFRYFERPAQKYIRKKLMK